MSPIDRHKESNGSLYSHLVATEEVTQVYVYSPPEGLGTPARNAPSI